MKMININILSIVQFDNHKLKLKLKFKPLLYCKTNTALLTKPLYIEKNCS